jgi:hypothetical protein
MKTSGFERDAQSSRIKQVKTNDLKYLSHQQIKDLLKIFHKHPYNEEVDMTNNKLHNQKELADMLNKYEYDARIGLSYETIHDEIYFVEKPKKTKKTKKEKKTSEPQSDEPFQPEQFYEERRGYDDSEDYIYQLQSEID